MESDTALITGAFALGGVIIGGVLNNWLTHVMERRRNGWAGKARARLFVPRMLRLALASNEAIKDEWTWGTLCVVAETNIEDFWSDFAEVFAGTFAWDEWQKVYGAVRPYEQMIIQANREATITEATADPLPEMAQDAVEAGFMLGAIGMRGPNRRRGIRGLFWSVWYAIRPLDEEKLLRDAGIDPDDPTAT